MTTQECPKCGPVPSDHSRFQRRLVPIEPVGGYEATVVELDEASDWNRPRRPPSTCPTATEVE